jgi:ribosomal protein S24E
MDMEILKQRDYPLLKRKRVSCMCDFTGATPSIIQFKESLASKLKVNKELVAIRHVYQRFGKTTAKVIAHVYETKEYKESLEKLKSAEKKELETKKKAAEEKKKAAEEAKKAKAEEKPVEKVEEKKEETKVEEKPVETPKEETKVEEKKEEAPKEVKEDGKETKTKE